jgi:integrase
MRRPKACPYRRGDGTYWARIRYTDETGKAHDKVERAANPADASAKSLELLRRYETEHGLSTESPTPITFNKFADLFLPHIEGQRSYKTNLGFLRTLRAHFGDKRLTAITYSDIQAYAKKRGKVVSARTGKRLKKASINREVALLSSMFKEAIEQGFAVKNPCKDGPRLIKPEEETKRDRILTADEEERLLAACSGRRAHLRPVIVAALDTGATKSQLLRLTWGDVHVGLRTIRFRSAGEKIVSVRMGEALASELANLQREIEKEYFNSPDSKQGSASPLFRDWIAPKRIFRDFKSAFPSACRAANLKDLRFNDLRHTSAVRYKAKVERVKAAFAAVEEKVESENSS